jgi:hypothetical protein
MDGLCLSVGGLPVRLRFPSLPSLVADVACRYDAFRIPDAPGVACVGELLLEPVGMGYAARRRGRKPEGRVTEARIEISAEDYEAELSSPPRGGGTTWSGTGRFVHFPESLDLLLRGLWSVLLGRADGALAHAAGLRLGDAGVLVPGASGAGKTTLGRKMRDPADVLTDEMAPVRRDEDGTWRLYSSPFWGSIESGGVSLRGHPLAVVAFPRKAEELAAQPVPPGEATRRLLETVFCFEPGVAAARRNLAWAARLCSEVPAVELRTSRETPAEEIHRVLAPWLSKAALRRCAMPSARESISEIRRLLRRDGRHALRSSGASMRPFVRDGDTLFVEAGGAAGLRAGDIVVAWHPGTGPESDRLVSHRLVAKRRTSAGLRLTTKGDGLGTLERFVDGREAEVLGRVMAVSRDGVTRRVDGGLERIAGLVASMARMPAQRLRGG